MKYLISTLLLALSLFSLPLRAELLIEITAGLDNPTSIAVAPFAWSGWGSAPEDIASVVQEDLRRSGQFAPVERADMLGLPTRESEVYYRDWRIVGMQYLVVGSVLRQGDGRLSATFSLVEVTGERVLFTHVVKGRDSELRDIAHYISDKVFYTITGIKGAFSTRLAYVTAINEGGRQVFRLMVSDADGAARHAAAAVAPREAAPRGRLARAAGAAQVRDDGLRRGARAPGLHGAVARRLPPRHGAARQLSAAARG